MRVLVRHGVLDAHLGRRMSDAVRFRHLLVHPYAEIDDDRVLAHLDDLDDVDDVDEFVAAVGALIVA